VTNALRWESSQWPLFRVLSADTFAANGSGPWTEVPYVDPDTGVHGIELQSLLRIALPAIGEAVLTQEFGLIDGEQVTPTSLLDKHIRIQAARRPVDSSTPQWRTVWVGRCDYQSDSGSPGSAIPRGTRTFRCVDLLYAYLSRYPMDRHADAVLSAFAYGHPGYNYDKEAPNLTSANKAGDDATVAGPDSTNIPAFGYPDAVAGRTAKLWRDYVSLENVMGLRRSAGDPLFPIDFSIASLDDNDTNLNGSTPFPVRESDMAWDVVNRMLDRKRGRTVAWLDWVDDVATPDGNLAVKLVVRPQIDESTSYIYGSSFFVLQGRDAFPGESITVDLTGDQRLDDSSFEVISNNDSVADELTSEGEQIETVVTASGEDATLLKAATAELEAAWVAADDDVKAQAVFRPVLQCFRLIRSANPSYKNGDGAGDQRADFWTDDVGGVTIAHTSVAAPSTVEVMDDLPLYEGYDYILATPAPAEAGDADGKPRRRKPMVMIRNSANRFVTDEDEGGATVSVDRNGIWVEWSDDAGDNAGQRKLDGADLDWEQLTLTVGLRMPQRPRITSAISGTVRRRKTIRVSDAHLWIAHPGAIWDLDTSTEDNDGSNARRVGGTVDGVGGKILRDDREAIAHVHFLAWEWYRSDKARLSCTWALRDCGLLPTWKDLAGNDVPFPRLGQCLSRLIANGNEYEPKTPITSVRYDNAAGLTTWTTEWTELDHG
jgi:hypothetical protein